MLRVIVDTGIVVLKDAAVVGGILLAALCVAAELQPRRRPRTWR